MQQQKFKITMPEKEPLKENVFGSAREFIDNFELNIGNDKMFKMFGIMPEKTYLLTGPLIVVCFAFILLSYELDTIIIFLKLERKDMPFLLPCFFKLLLVVIGVLQAGNSTFKRSNFLF